MDEDHIWEKVFLRDIYYIETIKSTHYCQVVHRAGVGRLHADITPLYQKLKPCFFRTKASTLANLALVQRVDTMNRILYFEPDRFCLYTKRVACQLKELLDLKSYRIP